MTHTTGLFSLFIWIQTVSFHNRHNFEADGKSLQDSLSLYLGVAGVARQEHR